MAESGIMTLPLLRGTIAGAGSWNVLYAREGYRVYPYSLGCMVRTNDATGTIPTHGKGEFAVNDYLIACSVVNYGDSYLFIPDTSRITKVTAVNASDDELTVSPAISVVAGEYLLNIETDGASVPTSAPDYDGSAVTLYTDNAGNNSNANTYLTTGQGGWFHGWVDNARALVDLLITDSSGAPVLVWPFYPVHEEILAP